MNFGQESDDGSICHFEKGEDPMQNQDSDVTPIVPASPHPTSNSPSFSATSSLRPAKPSTASVTQSLSLARRDQRMPNQRGDHRSTRSSMPSVPKSLPIASVVQRQTIAKRSPLIAHGYTNISQQAFTFFIGKSYDRQPPSTTETPESTARTWKSSKPAPSTKPVPSTFDHGSSIENLASHPSTSKGEKVGTISMECLQISKLGLNTQAWNNGIEPKAANNLASGRTGGTGALKLDFKEQQTPKPSQEKKSPSRNAKSSHTTTRSNLLSVVGGQIGYNATAVGQIELPPSNGSDQPLNSNLNSYGTKSASLDSARITTSLPGPPHSRPTGPLVTSYRTPVASSEPMVSGRALPLSSLPKIVPSTSMGSRSMTVVRTSAEYYQLIGFDQRDLLRRFPEKNPHFTVFPTVLTPRAFKISETRRFPIQAVDSPRPSTNTLRTVAI